MVGPTILATGGLDHVPVDRTQCQPAGAGYRSLFQYRGQASKSTPRGAVARFAAQGKGLSKKDLGLMAIAYGYVYVARVAMGFNRSAHPEIPSSKRESYDGPSIIIGLQPLHLARHRYAKGLEQQKLAVQMGLWPLYRFDPRLGRRRQEPR